MNTNQKLLLIVASMLTALATITAVNVAINFREYGYDNAFEKSKMTAEIVRDGLTAHMINGIMDKRDFFLSNIANAEDVEKLWIVRSDKVIEQFGEGLGKEVARDKIDLNVLQSGEAYREIDETANYARLRVTIPYIATSHGSPNCLNCHNVKANDVLGAISMEFNIDDVRQAGLVTIAKIVAINFFFLVIAILLTNYYFKPFMKLFSSMQDSVRSALHGDFSSRVKTDAKGEGREVAEQLNTLLEKLDATFIELKTSLSTFTSRSGLGAGDPLSESKTIIKELADVYKFKKTIERDKDIFDISARIARVLEEKYHVKNYALYKINKNSKERTFLTSSGSQGSCEIGSRSSICDITASNALDCRAFRTGTDVISSDFPNLCTECKNESVEYICIPFSINDEIDIILSLWSESIDEIKEINLSVASIKNYLETAKPVLESQMLNQKLMDSSLRDGLTGLYNRRFLDEFIESTTAQALRTNTSYTVFMLDIDYFKMVNDTYGHDVGDVVIKGLSELLRETVRKSDLAIRFGGEEFLVLLHNSAPDAALTIAEKIREKFSELKFDADKHNKIQKTLSIGIAHFPAQGDSLWRVIKYADTALYAAKHSGRNKVMEFTEAMFEEGGSY